MPKNRFSEEEKKRIVDAIISAEKNTSGEIRVHIDSKSEVDVYEKAGILFCDLEMDKTELKNGVLFYMAIDEHKYAIVGDKGINDVTSETFWDEIKDEMKIWLQQDKIAEALERGILMAGEALKKYFPYDERDVNELDDEISFGD